MEEITLEQALEFAKNDASWEPDPAVREETIMMLEIFINIFL